MAACTSCGVVVTDGSRVLLGHATHSPRWDIPKGLAEPGESHAVAAVRELAEETGLAVSEAELRPLGVHRYLRGKDLALFLWVPVEMPSSDTLICRSTFALPGGAVVPEFDRFGVFEWSEAMGKVGKNLARVLGGVARSDGFRSALPMLRIMPSIMT
jgi:8-oxo-dGTP pyrophosphatase MutT (NUDIX family)